MIEQNKKTDLHYAIQWNLDQLLSLNAEILNSFKLAELTLTLLDKGILNADLIELDSFKLIVEEGLKLFPELRFPLEINRTNLRHIVRILKVQRVGKKKFVMVQKTFLLQLNLNGRPTKPQKSCHYDSDA